MGQESLLPPMNPDAEARDRDQVPGRGPGTRVSQRSGVWRTSSGTPGVLIERWGSGAMRAAVTGGGMHWQNA